MKVTRKVFLSILSFVLLFIAFGASTFAWFTLGIDANVENVKVNIGAEEGIEISVDGFNWRANLDFEELTKDIEFADLTSINGYEIMNLDHTSPETNKDYFEKKIYIRMTQDGSGNPDFDGVMLSNMLGLYEDDEYDYNKWTSDEDLNKYGLIRGEEYIFDTINAVKVSFTKEVEVFEEITAEFKDNIYTTVPAFEDLESNIFESDEEDAEPVDSYLSAQDIYDAIEAGKKLYYKKINSISVIYAFEDEEIIYLPIFKEITATRDGNEADGYTYEIKEVEDESVVLAFEDIELNIFGANDANAKHVYSYSSDKDIYDAIQAGKKLYYVKDVHACKEVTVESNESGYEINPAYDDIKLNIFEYNGSVAEHMINDDGSAFYGSAEEIYNAIQAGSKLYYDMDANDSDKASSWGTVPEVKKVYKELKEADFVAGTKYFNADGVENAEASDVFEAGLYYFAGYQINEGLAYDYAKEKNFKLVMPTGEFQEYIGKDDLDDYEKSAILLASDFEVKGTDTTFVYAEITIRIWLEGWDPDCINSILEKNTEFNFTVKAYKED